MIEVDRDGALLAGCVSLSSLANELEWKDGVLRTPQDSMERRLDKSRCSGATSHTLKRLRTLDNLDDLCIWTDSERGHDFQAFLKYSLVLIEYGRWSWIKICGNSSKAFSVGVAIYGMLMEKEIRLISWVLVQLRTSWMSS
ncbi:hypothetical protein F2Q70_00042720 [Brassica cretica]|uniref:Uncharacterized protein n=1 Tax=Brassica cretica TaxID=69181 RepID=A0A8S9KF50_BRACR|nr:hypothetical protein F2Q70_00042720 [Brassica cretica]